MMTSPDLYKTLDPEEPITILEPGMSLAGRYKLIKQIGRGGMGVIWSAEEKAAGRRVVLKFVPNELKNFESAVVQLKESFRKIHGLQHQHICPVYTLEEEFPFGYYHVMKWLDGETLDEYMVRTVGRQAPLPFEEVLRILRPVAEALDYAHSQRIIHRDIKPSNIFILLNEQKTIRDVQVIDFGLAAEIRNSLSRVSQVRFDISGTRPYMAPEQWRGRLQSATTDQYSLAVTAYEMLAGYLPFEGDDAEMLRMAIMQDPPEPIRKMSEQVNAALSKALAKDGSERFGSCVKFVTALGRTASPKKRPAGTRLVLTIKGIEYPFRWCPAGTFTMGSPESEIGRYDDETQHQVTLSKGFWMLETPVTQVMWKRVMGRNPSSFKTDKRLPVEDVSWEDCQEFIKKLNDMGVAPQGFRFSLPTEAQWEYACRADTTTPFHFGSVLNGDKANCNGNYPYGTSTKGRYFGKIMVVGSYPANAWGLCDMHGNVWEWCSDWYGDYPSGAVTDPVGPSSGSRRVFRGGSWDDGVRRCRSACRYRFEPSFWCRFLGIRLSLVPVQ